MYSFVIVPFRISISFLSFVVHYLGHIGLFGADGGWAQDLEVWDFNILKS